MPYISARAIYLAVTFLIIVIFGITGTYYYLDLQKNIKVADRVSTPTQYNQEIEITPEETPQPTVSSQLSLCYQTCQFSFQCQGDLECLDVSGEKKCVNPSCAQNNACDCANDQEASPSADLVQLSQYNSEPNGIGGLESSPTPTVKPSPTVAPKPSIKPTAIATISAKTAENYHAENVTDEEYDPQLPDAGFPSISIFIIMIAIFSTSAGLILLNKKS